MKCVTVLSAAGYNHLDVVEYLLENGADVNARDKGGLIPLHNASSYGVRTGPGLSAVLSIDHHTTHTACRCGSAADKVQQPSQHV